MTRSLGSYNKTTWPHAAAIRLRSSSSDSRCSATTTAPVYRVYTHADHSTAASAATRSASTSHYTPTRSDSSKSTSYQPAAANSCQSASPNCSSNSGANFDHSTTCSWYRSSHGTFSAAICNAACAEHTAASVLADSTYSSSSSSVDSIYAASYDATSNTDNAKSANAGPAAY